MLVDRLDAERWRIHLELFEIYRSGFQNGEISAHVFRARLKSMGYRPHEIEPEVALNWPVVPSEREGPTR